MAAFRISTPGGCLAPPAAVAFPKRIVYVLKSDTDPARYYTGLTSNLAARLDAHNAGRVPHTASGKPWMIDSWLNSQTNVVLLRLSGI